jgi:Putative auto-transporter adhesin, head GIN domain
MKIAFACATALATLVSASAFAGTVVPLANFSGIHASDGASVTVLHGNQQRVTIIKGDAQTSVVEVHGDSLAVETCRHWCPRHYGLEVEVVTPNLNAVLADDGAEITAQGNFPAQPHLAVDATDGGHVDSRAIPAADVAAKADDGGMVETRATGALKAIAEDGGAVRYWGKPAVTLHSDDGGSISSGD